MGRLFTSSRVVVAVVALVAGGVVRGEDKVDLRIRREAVSKRGVLVRDIAVGGIAGAVVSGGALAFTSTVTSHGSQNWKPALAAGVGVGLLVGLTVGMIEANRYGQHEPSRSTSDGLSFQEQHHDRSGVFVAELPPVRF